LIGFLETSFSDSLEYSEEDIIACDRKNDEYARKEEFPALATDKWWSERWDKLYPL
jgi:hypothetical protein